MLRNSWARLAAFTLLGVVGPIAAAHASEPPSAKVARWHDRLCPRDLTPTVTSPLYGYYPTQWRLMPPEALLGDYLPPPVPPKKVDGMPPTRTNPPRQADTASKLSPYGKPILPVDARR